MPSSVLSKHRVTHLCVRHTSVPSPPVPPLSPQYAMGPERHRPACRGYNVCDEKLFPAFTANGWGKERGCSKTFPGKEEAEKTAVSRPGWMPPLLT